MFAHRSSKGRTARSFGGLRMTVKRGYCHPRVVAGGCHPEAFPHLCHPEASEGSGCSVFTQKQKKEKGMQTKNPSIWKGFEII
jgi:hypothetical protein